MAKKKMYTFSERRHSRKGITSTVLGSISVVIFIALTYFAWWSYGEGGAILEFFFAKGDLSFLQAKVELLPLKNQDGIYCGAVMRVFFETGPVSVKNISCIRFPRRVPSSAVWRWCCGSS